MTRPAILCSLCGAHGHLASACPWQSMTAALVARGVERDSPADSRVVDHDLRGRPITQAMVNAWAEARARRRLQPEEND
jgi:hypothetical protein